MNLKPYPKGNHFKGFTMMELLVAMSITTVIMLALLSLVGQASDSYTLNQRAVNSISQARAFVQFFERELSTRLAKTPLIHENTEMGGASTGDKLGFVRVVSSDEQTVAKPGDLNFVTYRIDFTQDDRASESPKLLRSVRPPQDTQLILNASNNPPFPANMPNLEEVVVANVLRFEARPFYFPPQSSTLVAWNPTVNDPPAVIELTLSFLDDSTAQRYKTRADWARLATSPRDSELASIRTFTRSIALAK